MKAVVLDRVALAYSAITNTALHIDINATMTKGADRASDNIAAGRGSGWNHSGVAEQQVMRRGRTFLLRLTS